MVKQYPDIIQIVTDSDYEQDVNGNFVPIAGSGSTFTSSCRAQPAGDNPVIKGDDGNDLVYSWVIYMPKTSAELEFGANVTLTRHDGIVFTGSLKRQYNGQLNSRLWV